MSTSSKKFVYLALLLILLMSVIYFSVLNLLKVRSVGLIQRFFQFRILNQEWIINPC